MICRFREYADLLTFDTRHDWHKWQEVYGFARINGSKRAYITYGGGPEGGIVRLHLSTVVGKVWYIWHRGWGQPASVVRIPPELSVVYRNDDGYEAVKLVMDDYEIADENEWFLDDLEDSNEELDDSEYRMRNDDDDEANEGRGGDSETEAEDEMEDEAEDYEALVSNEMREEVAALVEQIRDYSEQMGNESTPSGIMTLNMLINQAAERCRELRGQLAARGQS